MKDAHEKRSNLFVFSNLRDRQETLIVLSRLNRASLYLSYRQYIGLFMPSANLLNLKARANEENGLQIGSTNCGED